MKGHWYSIRREISDIAEAVIWKKIVESKKSNSSNYLSKNTHDSTKRPYEVEKENVVVIVSDDENQVDEDAIILTPRHSEDERIISEYWERKRRIEEGTESETDRRIYN